MSRAISSDDRLEALVNGDPGALARAISNVERHTDAGRSILRAIQPHLGRARVVGVTGVPGAGKSTLISRYVRELRQANKRVGVIAIDPSSPFSGGAVLGDRIRMAEHATDQGVFVRSLASRGQAGGLAPTATHVIDLMDAAGWDTIVVETVGAGQGEVDIADAADVRVVVCATGLGDYVQALKAGILEIADVLVVNKADLPGGTTMVNQLQAMLALRANDSCDVDVCETTATTGEGVAELVLLDEDAAAEQVILRDLRVQLDQLVHAFERAIELAGLEVLLGLAERVLPAEGVDALARFGRVLLAGYRHGLTPF